MTPADKPVLLIVELRMLGDAVLSLPFLRSASAKYRVLVCCQPAAANVFSMILPEEDLVIWEAPWSASAGKYKWSRWRHSGLGKLIAKLRAAKPDVSVCVWPDTRAQMLMALSGAPVRIGFPMTERSYAGHERPWRHRQLRIGRLLYLAASMLFLKPLLTRKVAPAKTMQNVVENWHQLADTLGLTWNTAVPWFTVNPSLDDKRYDALKRFCKSAKASGHRIWAIHPGAGSALRRWPVDRFQALLDTYLIPENIPVILISPPDCISPVPRNSSQILVETPGFRDLAAVIDMADCFLCNDSVAGHVAAALGKRVVSLFGPGSHELFAPFGNHNIVVCANACPHRPCFDRCLLPVCICMESITVDMVRNAIVRCE